MNGVSYLDLLQDFCNSKMLLLVVPQLVVQLLFSLVIFICVG